MSCETRDQVCRYRGSTWDFTLDVQDTSDPDNPSDADLTLEGTKAWVALKDDIDDDDEDALAFADLGEPSDEVTIEVVDGKSLHVRFAEAFMLTLAARTYAVGVKVSIPNGDTPLVLTIWEADVEITLASVKAVA